MARLSYNLAMTIELPPELEAAVKEEANAHGVSPSDYVREVLERELAASRKPCESATSFETGAGMFSRYGQAPSAEEIEANRAEMFHNFGEVL